MPHFPDFGQSDSEWPVTLHRLILAMAIGIASLIGQGAWAVAQATPLKREQMHRIIDQVVDPAEIRYDGCVIEQRMRSNMGANARAEFGCQRSAGNDFENFSLRVTLIARAHSSQICSRPYRRIEQDNSLGDTSCTTYQRGPETTAAGTSQLEMRYEVFDALNNGDKIAVSVQIHTAASAGNPPVDDEYLSALAAAYAEILYVPLRSMTLGLGMKMAARELPGRRGRAPASPQSPESDAPGDGSEQDQPPEQSKKRVLTIDNQTDLRLRFRQYFSTPEGSVFPDGPGYKELRVTYPVATVVGPHSSRSFQAELPPAKARIVYQPAMLTELVLNGEEKISRRPYDELFQERTVTYDIEPDTDYQTLTIRPENIRTKEAMPETGFPADLYIENNLSIPLRVYLEERSIDAQTGFESQIDGIIEYALGETTGPIRWQESRTIEPGESLYSNNLHLWPGVNHVLFAVDKQVSPWQKRDEFQRKVTVPIAGVGNMSRRFEIIVTEQDFLE